MRKFLIFTTLALSILTASADLLIYRSVEKVKITGGGHNGSQNYAGDWIIDPVAGEATIIRWYTLNGQKLYHTNSIPHMVFARIDGKNQSFTVLAAAGAAQTFSYDTDLWIINHHARGQNKNISVASDRTASYPQTMTGLTTQVGPDGNFVADLEAHVDFFYQQSMTVTNNDAGNDTPTILNAIASQLQNQGYQPAN